MAEEPKKKEKLTRVQKVLYAWSIFANPVTNHVLPLIYSKKRVVSEPANELLTIAAVDLADKIRRQKVIIAC